MSIISAIAVAIALLTVNALFYGQERKRFIIIWSLAWGIYAARMACHLVDSINGVVSFLTPLGHILALINAFVLIWGTLEFLGRRIPLRAGISFFSFSSAWVILTSLLRLSEAFVSAPVYFIHGGSYIWLGIVILQSRSKLPVSYLLAGWTFVIWGVHLLDYPFLATFSWAPAVRFPIVLVLQIASAIGLLVMFFQRQHEELITRERRFSLLADHAQDLIYRLRLRPDRAFEYISPAVQDILGYSPEEFYADPDLNYKIVHPEDLSLLQQRAAQPETMRNSLIVRWIRKDGELVYTEQLATPVQDKDGTIVAIEGVSRDVTALVQKQQRLEQLNMEMDMRSRELELFAGRIAHELRVPLRHIVGYTDILNRDHADNLGETGHNSLAIVTRAASSIQATAVELEHISRLSNWEFTPETLNLSALAQEVIASFNLSENKRRYRFEIGENLFARGDRRSLRVALHHLIKNAVTYTRDALEVVISFTCQDSVMERVFFLEDNGIGIPEEKLQYVFMPLFRAHETNYEYGAGLGLTTVKKVVENHGGRIWVESHENEGTRVCFTLPKLDSHGETASTSMLSSA